MVEKMGRFLWFTIDWMNIKPRCQELLLTSISSMPRFTTPFDLIKTRVNLRTRPPTVTNVSWVSASGAGNLSVMWSAPR
jgi:hypothetical protein